MPWCLNFVDANGRRKKEITTATTKEQALKLLSRRLGEVSEAKSRGLASVADLSPVQVTFREFLEETYFPTANASRRDSSNYRDRNHAENVLPFLGDKFLRSITAGDVERFRAYRLGCKTQKNKAPSPYTVNLEMQFLSAVLKMAQRHRLIDRNPAEGVRRVPVDKKKVRYLSCEEETELFKVLPGMLDGMLEPIVRTALLTGFRRGEIVGLRWEDVNWQRAEIVVGYRKNHEPKYQPMCEELQEILRDVAASGWSSEFVFPNPATGKPVKGNSVTHAFIRALKLAGIKDFRFHDLRHTFASRLVQAGVPLNTVRELLGQKSIQMTMIYAHLAPSNLRDAVKLLETGSAVRRASDKSPATGTHF